MSFKLFNIKAVLAFFFLLTPYLSLVPHSYSKNQIRQISTQNNCLNALKHALRGIHFESPQYLAELNDLVTKTYKTLEDPDLGFSKVEIDQNLKRLGISMEGFIADHYFKKPRELEDYSPEVTHYLLDLYAMEKNLHTERFWRKANIILGNPNYRKTLMTMITIEVINTAFWHVICDYLPRWMEFGFNAGTSITFAMDGHYMIANVITFTIAEVFLIGASSSRATGKLTEKYIKNHPIHSLADSQKSTLEKISDYLSNYFTELKQTILPVGFTSGSVGMGGAVVLQNLLSNGGDLVFKEVAMDSLWNALITAGFMGTASAVRYRFIFYLNELMTAKNIVNRERIFLELYYGNLLVGAWLFLKYQQAIDHTKEYFGFAHDEKEKEDPIPSRITQQNSEGTIPPIPAAPTLEDIQKSLTNSAELLVNKLGEPPLK